MSKRFILLLFFLSSAYFITALYVVAQLANGFYEDELKQQRELVRQKVSLAKSSLEAIIYQNIYLADSLSTVVNIDLNHFKQVNDTLGHDAGDELLKFVAKKMQQHIRTGDVVARMGGDEFLMVLTRLQDASEVDTILTSLKRRIQSESMIWEDTEVVPSLSMGYVVASPDANDVEALLSHADEAMYADKKKVKA